MELQNKNISNFAYPIIIFITGWYIISNLYRLFGEWAGQPHMYLYAIVWTLVPIAFTYLYLNKVKLTFKWSLLTAYSIIMVIAFVVEAILLPSILNPFEILLSGWWDHTFFPIAFGLFFLCDLNKIPKKFWYFLVPFAIFITIPNINVVSNIFFNNWALQLGDENSKIGFFTFFNGANNWNDVNAISKSEFFGCL